jgi:anti-sigma B factor antagonist
MYPQTTLETENRASGIKVIHIQGDLDSMGTHKIGAVLTSAIESHRGDVIVNLRQVGFISSAGMAMLLVKGKMLRSGGGRLVIAAPTQRVLEVLSLAGFHELFEVYATLDDALAALEG